MSAQNVLDPLLIPHVYFFNLKGLIGDHKSLNLKQLRIIKNALPTSVGSGDKEFMVEKFRIEKLGV